MALDITTNTTNHNNNEQLQQKKLTNELTLTKINKDEHSNLSIIDDNLPIYNLNSTSVNSTDSTGTQFHENYEYDLRTKLEKTSPLPSTLTTSLTSSQSFQTPLAFNQEAIDALIKRTGYSISQENGQRKYGPAPDWGTAPEPDRNCEVFIGKIPRDCFEDEIIPVLERIGKLYEFRLMMEYSGYNRGYGFVMYTSREDAKKAVIELNNYEIRKGRMIGVCGSVDNCRLFVGGIPKNKKKEEILEEMKKITEDVVNVIVYPSAHDKNKNRGFAFVQYANHRAAAIARRKLIPARIQLFGQPIAVDWAEPEPEVDEEVMATVRVLYVRNLMLTTSEELIKSEFEKFKPGSVERVKKMKDFAFVHFKDREDAISSMKIMNGAIIDGSSIEVSLSKPVEKSNLMKFIANSPNTTNQLLLASNLASNSNKELNILLNAQGINTATALPSSTVNNIAAVNQILNIPYQNVGLIDPMLQYSQFLTTPHNNLLNNSTTSLANQNLNMQSFHHLQSNVLTPNQILPSINYPAEMNNYLNPYQINSLPSNLNKRPMRTIPLSSTRAANIYRSNNSNKNIKKQATTQELNYDLYSDIKSIPVLPLHLTSNFTNDKMPCQVLEEFCLKEGIPAPVYTLHKTTGQDQDGKEICLFLYKILVPGLFNNMQLSSNKLLQNIDEAKNEAAEFFLTQLFSQPYNDLFDIQKTNIQQQHQQPQLPVIQSQLVYNPTGQALTNPHSLIQLQQQQQQINSLQSNSTISSNDANNLYPLLQTTLTNNHRQQQQQQPQQQPQMTDYHSNIIPSQFVLDPTGKFLICQSSWQ